MSATCSVPRSMQSSTASGCTSVHRLPMMLRAQGLPGPSVLYGPPSWVRAVRNGDEVTITWDGVNMTQDDDRGYFIEGWVCQDGAYFWWTVSIPDQYTTTYTIKDQKGCSGPSSGKLYAVEKHGYITPVDIPWP